MTDIYVAKRVIDYVGLNARGIPDVGIQLHPSMQPVLALLQAMGSDGAQLLNVDKNGNLGVSTAGAAVAGNQILLSNIAATNLLGFASAIADQYGGGQLGAIATWLENNAGFDRARSASAANLAAQSGLGAALSSGPGEWTISSLPGAAGTQASVTKAAGAAGVRHVLKSLLFSFGAIAAPVATQLQAVVRDGTSGVGAIIFGIQVSVPAAVFATISVPLSGLNIVGSAATAMTVEFTAGLANLAEGVSASGYDAS